MILLDTHALIWLDGGSPRLGPQSRAISDAALVQAALYVCAMTFWECALLTRDRRLALSGPVAQWREELVAKGLREFAIDGAISAHSVVLDLPHKDPADRFIVATALAKDALLVTADERILAWTGPLRRQDARL